MKIERLYLVGFGKLRDCEIVFDPEKVNLLIEENEFGKSTIVAAIVAALYGFPPQERSTAEALSEKETYRPEDGGPYRIALDVRALGFRGWTRMRIVRDFRRGLVRVFDLDMGGKEITEEFAQRRREVGEVLLRLSRAQFLNTCLVRQAALQALPDLSDLSAHLQRIADAEAGDRTAAEAIEALHAALAQFPASRMGKGPLHIDTEIKRAEQRLRELQDQQERLEQKRRQIEPQLDRIREIEQEIERAHRQQQRAHYLRERAERQRLERELRQRQELEAERRRLEQERQALAAYETFPAARWSDLERELGALQRIARERMTIEGELKRAEHRYAEVLREEERFGPLALLTQRDREQLAADMHRCEELQQEIREQQQRVHAEQQRLAQRGIHLEEFERLQRHVGLLEPEERRRVCQVDARARDLERQQHIAQERRGDHLALCQEIERERERTLRRAKRALRLAQAFALGLPLAFLLDLGRAAIPSGLLSLLAFGLWLFLRHAARTHRAQEWARATAEAERLQREIERLEAERASLEESVHPLLARTGWDSREALAQACARLETLTAELQPLLLRRNALHDRERELHHKRDRLRELLERAGRSSAEPTPEEIERLRQDLDRVLDLRRDRAELEDRIARAKADLERARQDEREHRERILALLREARVLDPTETTPSLEELEAAGERFRQGVQRHNLLQKLTRDLEHVERRLRELPELAVLRERYERVCHSLRQREAEDPTLAAHLPERSPEEYAAEADHWSKRERACREELTGVRTQIASALDELEKQRPEVLERQQELRQHLARVRSFRRAVELARDVFEQIAREIHGQWAEDLTRLSRELLRTLDTDYAALSFDPHTLQIRVALKEPTSILQTNQLRSQLSLGTREQLHLITRLAVSRYLSRECRLPFIFDEPFAHSDDERFLRLMRLLLGELSREHQIIVASCHRQRHEWLRTQVPDLFARRVHWCALRPLRAL
jgi:DNA repair exonuclease SbcCD ATPase subunit